MGAIIAVSSGSVPVITAGRRVDELRADAQCDGSNYERTTEFSSYVCFGSEADVGELSLECLLYPRKRTFRAIPVNVRFVPIAVIDTGVALSYFATTG